MQAALFMTNVHTLAMEEVHIEDSTGGLLGLNVFGDSVVLNSRFHCNNINNTIFKDGINYQRRERILVTLGAKLCLYNEI